MTAAENGIEANPATGVQVAASALAGEQGCREGRQEGRET